jgi:hypothetical protein
MRYACAAALLIAASGCGAEVDERARHEDVTVPLLYFSADSLPHGLELPGTVVGGARWRDNAAENLVVLVQSGAVASADPECADCRDASVHALQLVRSDGEWTQLWRMADHMRSCEFDLWAAFVEGSVVVTDLNRNGVAETTFQYTLACRSDVSPAVRKLVMHEGSAAYEIRGTTDLRPRFGPEAGGGLMRVHPSFETADEALRVFALREWHRLIAADAFEQF